jgi:hypothetical protein
MLDPDVAEALKQMALRRRQPFKVVLNTIVRAGLAAERTGVGRYKVPARPMGLRAGIDLDKALALADSLEDEERIRKLTFGE